MSRTAPPPTLLQTRCDQCAGLCCVATGFSRSADFAEDRAPGQPCPRLGPDSRCTIHDQLRERGWQGCVAFDCFGAGQRITARLGDWRDRPPAARAEVFEAWHRMVGLHQLLWHLHQAAQLRPADDEVVRLQEQVRAAAEEESGGAELRAEVNRVLLRISAEVRQPAGPSLARAMLLGATRNQARLRRADLFGACLVGAQLREADLRGADLRGTDLRGADLRGADLRGALFLVPGQLSSSRGDDRTRVDGERPESWGAG